MHRSNQRQLRALRQRRGGRGRTLRLATIASLAVSASLAALVIYGITLLKQLPSPDQLTARRVNQSTKLYDRTGQALLYEIHGEEKRTVIPFNDIPGYVKFATLAAEDVNFYNEPAFNWTAIVRALIQNLRAGHIVQGGSTISQQLVKNVFLTSEQTFTRKLKELVLAIELETKYSKDQILDFYLNQIPYGSNAYGIEAASQLYFSKSARDLSLAESAVLAALPRAPSYYSPWGSHANELLARKDYILDRMAEYRLVTTTERDTAKQVPVTFAAPSIGTIIAPHFSLAVRDQLIERYGEQLVMNGGLKIITTLDTKLQETAERVVAEGVQRNQELYNSRNGAMVVQDPKTGQILALVGSRDYFDVSNEGNFNVAMQGLRQPGSALKPFVYLTAFQKGYPPRTMLYDVPTEFDTRKNPATSYRPVNFDARFRGAVSLENALAQSINVIAVKVLYLAGFDDVLKNLHRFGITTLKERWRYGLSLTLGGGEVRLIDLVNAYATLSQDGVRHEQRFILKVEDARGNVLEEYRDSTERVADPQYPQLVTQILSDEDLRAPLYQSSLPLTVFPDHDVALKTGTTEDYRDAWALGYTPSLVVGVWAGNNDNAPMAHGGSSVLAAIPMWSAFLREVLPSYPSEAFERPEPQSPIAKPLLNGQAEFAPVVEGKRYPQLHSILYYVRRDDPLGDPPDNPAKDPQYENWEGGVIDWARINIQNFQMYNAPLPPGTGFTIQQPAEPGDVAVVGLEPQNGSFVSTPLTVRATLQSPTGVAKVELYLNRNLVNGFTLSHTPTKYQYYYYFTGQLEPQNLIELVVTDRSGRELKVPIVVFH